jgi:signal transduction histidine kinase
MKSKPPLTGPGRLHEVSVGEPVDSRVRSVLEVLAGGQVADVAQRWSIDASVLDRWVRAFVDAGTAQVTNRPDPDAAHQRDRFLAAFAHELRTPLAVARGWVAVLADDDVPPDAVAGTVRRLDDALERLAERTLDVELLAAASLGRLRVAPEVVSVDDLSTDLPGLETVDGENGEGGHTEIEVDPVLFRRVLRDLWQAGSSLPVPRSLRLEVAAVSPWVELRVVRDADPIDVAVLQALFEPFDLNDDGTGVTIGLYLARALTVAHGGTIGVDQDDHSASLWVRVPRRRPPTEA